MPLNGPERDLLVRTRGLGGQVRVYQTADALEVQEFEHGDVTRKRVFYDDVLLVTYHRALGWPFLAVAGAAAAVSGYLALQLASRDGRAALVLFGLTGLPLLVALLLRLALGVHTVMVFGKRSRVRLSFGVRGGRAREAFEGVCRRVRREQERLARQGL